MFLEGCYYSFYWNFFCFQLFHWSYITYFVAWLTLEGISWVTIISWLSFGKLFWCGIFCHVLCWFENVIYIAYASYCSFQPEDSNSKVVANGDDLLVEDMMDSIASVLRKEIEGKVSISKPNTHTSIPKGKES